MAVKKEKSNRGRKITELEKTGILVLLKHNKGNLSKTARNVGVCRDTISRWIKEDTSVPKLVAKQIDKEVAKGLRVQVPSSIEKLCSAVTDKQIAEGIKNLTDIVPVAMLTWEISYRRLLELIEYETDIDKLTKLIIALSKIQERFEGDPGKKITPGETIKNSIPNIQMNFQGNETLLAQMMDRYEKLQHNQ
jgi:hypothetical protein